MRAIAFLAGFTLLRGAGALPAVGDFLAAYPCAPAGDASRQVFDVIAPNDPNADLAGHIAVHGTENSSRVIVWDLAGPSNAPGTPVHVWGSYTPPVRNQQWVYTPSSGAIASVYAPTMCLAVAGVFAGAALTLSPCNASDVTQRFAYNGSSLAFTLQGDASLCLQAGATYVNCTTPPFNTYPYCDASLPTDARVADLISRMTPAEKAAALDSSNPAIPRLAAPSLASGEGLHGVVCGCMPPTNNHTGCATSFPAPSALAAAFDTTLWGEVGGVIGMEARALYNAGAASMWLFAPNVNLARDPRWGRNQEVPGEDPFLAAEYGVAYVTGGQQGADPRYIQAAFTLKHSLVYDMEGYEPRTDVMPRPASAVCDTPGGCQRWNLDLSPPARDFVGYFLPPFEAAVSRAHVRSIMCSYNGFYGQPACAASALQNDYFRGELGWDGHMVSDYTALELMQDVTWNSCQPPYPPLSCTPQPFDGHNYTFTVGDTVNVALDATVDVNLGPLFEMWLGYLVSNGSVPAAAVDAALAHYYRTHFLMGLFDDPAGQLYPSLPPAVVDSPSHRAVALQAAVEALVLLQNKGGLLPLTGAANMKIAFIGPHANATEAMLSNYHGANTLVDSHSPLLAALARGWDVTYARGCNICDVIPPGFPNMPCPPNSANDTSGIPAAVAAAAAADVAVLFLGLDQTSEAENFDRTDIGLPGVQETLLRAVYAAQPRTVVVLINGGSISSPWMVDNIPAILEAWYGGELGGDAIVGALAGTFNPGGKMPVTTYYPNITTRDVRNVDLADAGGITYQYFTGPVLFPFGWGLSYTTFSYQWVNLSSTILSMDVSALAAAPAGVPVAVNVTNTGTVAGDAVVLAFQSGGNSTDGPLQALFGFTRMSLEPGQWSVYTFPVTARALSRVDEHGRRVLRVCEYTLRVGDVVAPAVATLQLTGAEGSVVLEQNAWYAKLVDSS